MAHSWEIILTFSVPVIPEEIFHNVSIFGINSPIIYGAENITMRQNGHSDALKKMKF